ncbi:hypothetical protein LguiA_024226 [Lonicera macranthoides]
MFTFCVHVVIGSNFRKLAEPRNIDTVDWSKWLVFFLDERVVPLNHRDCNSKLAYDGFLCKMYYIG